jgi:hypothetical protein
MDCRENLKGYQEFFLQAKTELETHRTMGALESMQQDWTVTG